MTRVLLTLIAMWMVTTPGLGVHTAQGLPAVSELVWTKPDRFWFRKTVSGTHLWLGVDAQYGVKEPLFDHQRLAIELGVRTGGEFTPNDLPLADPAARFVVKYDGSNAYIQEGAMAIEFILGGSHWRCDLQIKWNWNLVPPTDYECLSRRPVIPGVSDKPIVAPTVVRSPDGLWDARIENHNVLVHPASGGAPTQKLTTDGTSAFAYQTGSITWATDSKSLMAYRVHEQVWLAPSVSSNVKAQLHRATLAVQSGQPPPTPEQAARAARTSELRGAYDRYRANNDLLHYALTVRVDPDKKFISGKNRVRFKMLSDDTRIRLDLYANLAVDKVMMGSTALKTERELNAVFIDFPETLRSGRTYEVDFHYSGSPAETGRFGGIAFRKDPAGRHWINTACEGEGSSIWWPSKDQWRDEVESMDLSVEIPKPLVDVSNGRFMGKTDLGDGYTRWDWRIHYPINSYNVSLNIGTYEHFGEKMGDLTLDYYVLPENVAKAKVQFAQTKPMLRAFEHYFGEYPFPKDGFKLIEVPYSGMEHQSAVTYGNRFANGYLERDWTGVGISTKFDFIIIHESGHEWFGNAVSAADVSDMWIQEGWTTYLECLYVERLFGSADGLKYTNAYKTKIQNRTPIITERGLHRTPPQDMYFKGALFLHTLRGVVDNDEVWWKLIRDFYQANKYKNIMTEDVVAFFNARLKRDLTPVFDQYLRRTAVPTLELDFATAPGSVRYRWKADEAGFNMPVRVGQPEAWQVITPTSEWKSMPTPLSKDAFQVATDLYYVLVEKR